MPSVRRAALALLAALAACTAPRNHGERVDRCVDAKTAARQALAATQACTSDLDCVPYLEHALGCDGVRSLASPEPAGLEEALVDACTGVTSRALDCAGSEMVCEAGQCRAKAWPGACPQADAALRRASAASKGAACERDDDCAEVQLGSSPIFRSAHAVPKTFGETAAPALAAYLQACGRAPFDPGRRGRAACVERACTVPPSPPPRQATCSAPGRYEKPIMKEPRCLARQIGARLEAVGRKPTGRHVVKFLVGPDGRPGFFSLETAGAPELEAVLASAALACDFEPGRDPCGRPAAIWLAAPLHFSDR